MLYVYLIENLLNDKKYIGKHSGDINDNYFGSGILLNKAIKKYGIQNFRKTIIETTDNLDHLNDLEIKYIKQYRELYGSSMLYNLTDGGTGGDTCRFLDPDVVSKTRSGWFIKLSPEEQTKLRKLKSDQMKLRRQNPISETKRINSLKDTNSKKSKDQIFLDYDNRRGGNCYSSKKVNTPFGKFESIRAAMISLNISHYMVSSRCKDSRFSDWIFE